MAIEYTAAGGGKFKLCVNDEIVSEHTAEREVNQEIINHLLRDPGAEIYYTREYRVDVSGSFEAPEAPVTDPPVPAPDPDPEAELGSFRIYNGTKMDLPILSPIGPAYAGQVYRRWWKGMSPEEKQLLPTQANIAACVEEMRKVNPRILFWDLEHWDTYDPDPFAADQNIANMIAVQQLFRQAAPGMLIGCYDMVPKYLSSHAPPADVFAQWQARNDRMQPLADAVDFLAPNRYGKWVNTDPWLMNLAFQNAEARRLAPDKPLLNFLWPQWPKDVYGRTETQGQHLDWVPGDTWRFWLEAVYESADGAIIYIPHAWHDRQDEVRAVPWYDTTREFMAEKGLTIESEATIS